MYGSYERHTEMFRALPTALAIEAAVGDKSIFNVKEPVTVNRVGIQVTVPINYDTPTALCVCALDRRIAFGSDTGRVELDTITIPDGTPAGTVIYADFGDTNLDVGDQLVFEVKTQGAGGAGIAGDYEPFFCYRPRAETPANQSEQTVSA